MALTPPKKPAAPAAGPITSAMFPAGTAPIKPPMMAPLAPGDFSNPTDMANKVIGYQNQANTANNERYNQGLSVLGNTQQQTGGLYGDAKQKAENFGNFATSMVDESAQKGAGSIQQSAVSRGLGNTTITDALMNQNTRNANLEKTNIQEQKAQMLSGIDQNQAGLVNSQGNATAGFVEGRNDQAPDIGEFSRLAQSAAAGNYGKAPHFTGGITSPNGGAQALQKAQSNYNSGGGSATPSSGGYFAGLPGGGFTDGMKPGGGGGGSPAPAGGGYGAPTGPITSALGGAAGGDPNASAAMSNAGYAPGSISITPTAPAPAGGPIQQAMQASPSVAAPPPPSAPASPADTAPFMGNANSGNFTKSQWAALTPDQQRNVLAGRKVDQGAAPSAPVMASFN